MTARTTAPSSTMLSFEAVIRVGLGSTRLPSSRMLRDLLRPIVQQAHARSSFGRTNEIQSAIPEQ